MSAFNFMAQKEETQETKQNIGAFGFMTQIQEKQEEVKAE